MHLENPLVALAHFKSKFILIIGLQNFGSDIFYLTNVKIVLFVIDLVRTV